jgi:hypothetical protein
MATPRVFISSTFYDLKYIRENIKYFIKTLGYDPILSEEGDIFYNPIKHTQDSCLSEVPTCQIFVLIIGGRFGGAFKGGEKSITNAEYEEALKHKIPIFTLVENSVYSEHNVYNENLRNNKKIKPSDISYPSVDSIKVFEFIDEVRKSSVNNAIVPFKDFTDIESYLKKQWAGMLFNFLTENINEKKITDTLGEIKKMNDKIEYLSERILISIGKETATLTIELYDEIISTESYRSLIFMKVKPRPIDFIKNKSFTDCASSLNIRLDVSKEHKFSQSQSGNMSLAHFQLVNEDYKKVRENLINILSKRKWTVDKYIKEFEKENQ